MVKYTSGPLSVGYQVNESDYGTGTQDEDFSAIGISYAVSDDLSVSLNSSTIDFEATTKDDQEANAVSFSYTSGGMTFGFQNISKDNINGTAVDHEMTEIQLTMAF